MVRSPRPALEQSKFLFHSRRRFSFPGHRHPVHLSEPGSPPELPLARWLEPYPRLHCRSRRLRTRHPPPASPCLRHTSTSVSRHALIQPSNRHSPRRLFRRDLWPPTPPPPRNPRPPPRGRARPPFPPPHRH